MHTDLEHSHDGDLSNLHHSNFGLHSISHGLGPARLARLDEEGVRGSNWGRHARSSSSNSVSPTSDAQEQHIRIGIHVFETFEGDRRKMQIVKEKGTSNAGVCLAQDPQPPLFSPGQSDKGEQVILKIFDIRYAHNFQEIYGYEYNSGLGRDFVAFAEDGKLQIYIDSLTRIVDDTSLPAEILGAIYNRPIRHVDTLELALRNDEYLYDSFEVCLNAGLVEEDARSHSQRNIFATCLLYFSFLWEVACLQQLDQLTHDIDNVMPRPRYFLQSTSMTSKLWSFPYDTIALQLLPGFSLEDATGLTRSLRYKELRSKSSNGHVSAPTMEKLQVLAGSMLRLATILPKLGFEHNDLAPSNVWLETNNDHTFKDFQYIDAGGLSIFLDDDTSHRQMMTRLESLINRRSPTEFHTACPSLEAFSHFTSPSILSTSVRQEERLYDMLGTLIPDHSEEYRFRVAKFHHTYRWKMFDSVTTTLQWWIITGAVSRATPVKRCSLLIPYLRIVRSIMEQCIEQTGTETSVWFTSSIRILHNIHKTYFKLLLHEEVEDGVENLATLSERLARQIDPKATYDVRTSFLYTASRTIITSGQLFVELVDIPADVGAHQLELVLAGLGHQHVSLRGPNISLSLAAETSISCDVGEEEEEEEEEEEGKGENSVS